jgi:hypothetical protein
MRLGVKTSFTSLNIYRLALVAIKPVRQLTAIRPVSDIPRLHLDGPGG